MATTQPDIKTYSAPGAPAPRTQSAVAPISPPANQHPFAPQESIHQNPQPEYQYNESFAPLSDDKQPHPPTVNPIQALYTLPRQPATITCPACLTPITTTTTTTPARRAWLWGACLCCFLTPLLACVPCCIRSCKDVEHRCPNCKKVLAKVSPEGEVVVLGGPGVGWGGIAAGGPAGGGYGGEKGYVQQQGRTGGQESGTVGGQEGGWPVQQETGTVGG